MVTVDGDFAAQDLSERAELGVEVLVRPLCGFEASDEDRGALHVFATWFSSDGMQVVRESSAHESTFDPWVSVLFHCFLGILDGVEHHKSVVEGFEQWPKQYIENIRI